MDTLTTSPIRCSIIVPTHNDRGELEPCLLALRAELAENSELIVVIDGSPAEPATTVARAVGARVLALERRGGPAAARNHGATHAQGEVLVFVDADVLIRAGGLERIEQAFADDPALTAMFGSYDDSPRSSGLVSRYRNLLHHFVHQEGRAAATTFWAGLGAVRRVDFWNVGGFDAAAFTRPSVEDIELGYRLRAAGGRILLDRELQGTHLKRWTLSFMIRTDVSSRAVPWASLVLLALVGAVLAFWRPVFLMLVAVALLTVASINRRFYRLLWRRGGIR